MRAVLYSGGQSPLTAEGRAARALRLGHAALLQFISARHKSPFLSYTLLKEIYNLCELQFQANYISPFAYELSLSYCENPNRSTLGIRERALSRIGST